MVFDSLSAALTGHAKKRSPGPATKLPGPGAVGAMAGDSDDHRRMEGRLGTGRQALPDVPLAGIAEREIARQNAVLRMRGSARRHGSGDDPPNRSRLTCLKIR